MGQDVVNCRYAETTKTLHNNSAPSYNDTAVEPFEQISAPEKFIDF